MKKINKYIYMILFFTISLLVIPASAQSETVNQVKSKAFVLMDGDTGQVLIEKNMNDKMYPASITKVMTAMIALERGNLDDTITMSYDAVFSVGRDTSHIALDENEKLTLEQALYALAISSANDAANGIAEYVSGSMKTFSEQMTEQAKKVGALNTNFSNAHGLPDENHYTTPYDMARIIMAAAKIPEFIKIFGAATYDMPPTNIQKEARTFNRKNSLLNGDYKYDGAVAEKTGWTPDAGFTYVSVAIRNGRTLIAVLMKSPDETTRWEDATILFNYGFNELVPLSFGVEELMKEDYVIEGADGMKIDADLIPDFNFNCLVEKALSKEDIEIKYVLSSDGTDGKIQGKAMLSLSDTAVLDSQYAKLGEVSMQVQFDIDGLGISENKSKSRSIGVSDNSEAQEMQNDETAKKSSVVSVIFVILKTLGIILLILATLTAVIFVRRHIIIQRRRKRRAEYIRKISSAIKEKERYGEVNNRPKGNFF